MRNRLASGHCHQCGALFTQSKFGRSRMYCKKSCKQKANRFDRGVWASQQTDSCDCGAAKGLRDEACPRCIWLDGRGAEMTVVSALRVLGEVATMAALVEETGVCERTVYRCLARLQETGRVVVVDSGKGEAEALAFRYVRGDDVSRNAFHSGRAGYYVAVQPGAGRRGGTGHVALYILKNRRAA